MNPRSLIAKTAKAWPLWCSMVKTASAFAPSASNFNIHTIGRQGSSFQSQPTSALRPNECYNNGNIQRWMSTSLGSFPDEGAENENEYGSSTSVNFAMNPDSDEARSVTESLGISPEKHDILARHAQLVVEWNERLNLISRKDCNLDVVFGRHTLPSVALAGLPDFPTKDADEDGGNTDSQSRSRIVDVGTGGGFPGVPLAIIYPDVDFLLVDSVGKKLKAVDEMVAELGLENVQTFHGRAEEIVDDPIKGRKHKNAYDICVGRSVSALPRFCFWTQDLLKKKNKASKGKSNEGRLVYIIGGTVESSVTTRVVTDIPIDDLLECDGASDKRVLVVSSSDVVSIARESGEKRQKRGQTRNKVKNNSKRTSVKGKWQEKDNSAQKQRGYENFKRYGSN